MRIITCRDKLIDIINNWSRFFPKNILLKNGKQSDGVFKKLSELDIRTCPEDKIKEILGDNNKWLDISCNICGRIIDDGIDDFVVELVDSHSFGNGFCICERCGREILIILRQHNEEYMIGRR